MVEQNQNQEQGKDPTAGMTMLQKMAHEANKQIEEQ